MTGRDETRRDTAFDEREAIEQLLPWYVTGKLDPAEAAKVSAYLVEHDDMTRQVELVRQEQRASIQANEALGAPSAQSFERLMASIAASEARPRARRRSWWEQWGIAGLFAAPGAMRWAAVAAAVVIVAQAAIIVMLATNGAGQGGAEGYKVAAGPKGADGVVAMVTFAEGATAAAITGFLGDFDATIIDGPKPGGVYRVRFTAKAADGDDVLRRAAARKDVIGRIFR